MNRVNMFAARFPHLLAFAAVAAWLAMPSAGRAVDARLLRHPDVSASHIAFVYAGDIWIVPKEGGMAQRLSSPPGEETAPKFSPDGRRIAFTGNYDGNPDIYVIDVAGGTPTRLTHHPAADRVVDWAGDGRSILFASTRESGSPRFSQLFRVSDQGGLPEKLPLPFAETAAISDDGNWIALTTMRRQDTWKRYRGGTAPDLWLFHLKTFESKRLAEDPATDELPMWRGRTLYFLSDRGPAKRYNLWSLTLDDPAPQQVTHFTDTDVQQPSIGPQNIVFEAGGRLHLLDLSSGKHAPVEIRVVTDLAGVKAQSRNVAKQVASMNLSPSGRRVLVEARGEVFSMPAEHGPILNLTQSSGVAERFPAWSPDGKWIAWWTDRSGDYELVVRSAEGTSTETNLTSFGPGYRYQLFWSPDSRRIAFVDQQLKIWIVDTRDRSREVAHQLRWIYHNTLQSFRVSWSPDSRWLAYSAMLDNANEALFVYDVTNHVEHRLTSGFYSDRSPVFDPDGKYLYCLTDREMRPVYGRIDPDMWTYPNATRLAAFTLRQDVPSPLAARNDTEDDATKDKDKENDKDKDPAAKPVTPSPPESKDTKNESRDKTAKGGPETKETKEPAEPGSAKAGKDEKGGKTAPVSIDLEGFEARWVILPPPAGNYGRLAAVSGKLIYVREPDTGATDAKPRIRYYDLKERKEETVLDDARTFSLSADGRKMLVARDEQAAILELKKDQKFEKPLALDRLEMTIDPRAEWRQIFTDAWRFNRDYFYDPGLHGLDWAALRDQYGRLLDDAVTRWDVNHVIGELIGELNASHTYRGGGDLEAPRSRGVGLLGVDWELHNGAYRIRRILQGAPWDHEARSPLAEPGLQIKAGDYVLAVNRQPLDLQRDPWSAFEGLEKRTVLLTVNDKPSPEGAREMLVETIGASDEVKLRQLAWIEANRRRVDEASSGRIGYIYMPDTANAGQNNLMRQFKAQFHKEGLIIDERFNGGGQLADRFLELLSRPPYANLAWRYGPDRAWPGVAHFGPQAMLINGWAGSGGDALPWFFRTSRRGPLIGTRTWGGLIGPAMGHQLIDGGSVVVPPGRLFGTDGRWFAEGHGVDPDVFVPEDLTALARGQDNQLERAIREVEEQIRQKGTTRPTRPPYEKR